MALLAIEDALSRVLNAVGPLDSEIVSVHEAHGRVVAADINANLTQPPFDASAMDGYAVRFEDIGTPLEVAGESQAGKSYGGVLCAGEAVRIFTGAPMVAGADTVVIQENVTRSDDQITVNECKAKGANIRAAGGDFSVGETLVSASTVLDARHIALLAAGNVAEVKVFRRPVVAILSTGDELLPVGSEIDADKIVNSNAPMFMALVKENGGTAIDLGVARDTILDVKTKIDLVKDVDIFVTIGGASVGDYDIIQDVLKDEGLKVDFWKVAMQPGKPIIFGDFKGAAYFGMPGNPSSAYVCFVNFMLPAMDKMQGKEKIGYKESRATLEHELKPGGGRVNYIRAFYVEDKMGNKSVNSKLTQSSANLKTLARSNCLLVREIDAPNAEQGDLVKIILIEP